MKRTFISFAMIIVIILAIVIGDICFMTDFASGMTKRLEMIIATENMVEQKELAHDLDEFYKKRVFLAHRLIPTDRIEEIEMLLHKLNAYIGEKDKNEIEATAAEIKARVNLLYSTTIYHWYHPFEFSIR